MNDGRIDSVCIRRDTCNVYCTADRTENRDGIVGSTVSYDTHGDEHDHQIDKDSCVCKPAELLERPHLSEEELNMDVNIHAQMIKQTYLHHMRPK